MNEIRTSDEKTPMKFQGWKRTVGQKIRQLSPEQAQQKLDAISAEGITMYHATIRELTGGFNSQSINFYVIRKLADKVKSAKGRLS
jgi:hypothetical protein